MRSLLTKIFIVLTLVFSPLAASADDAKAGLFITLTTDDTWAAAKAISFAHQKSLKSGHETAIWLNVRGVYLADKKRPSHIHGLMAAKGKSVQNLLTDFMTDGGVVIMCGACSKAAGLTKADYIDGVVMGNWDLVEGWLFKDNMRTLAW